MATNKTIRRCKVHGRSGYRYVAWLRIGGLWMEKCGFNVGDPIEVTVENGVMTIKKLTDNGDSGN